jgi:hypothetical protein
MGSKPEPWLSPNPAKGYFLAEFTTTQPDDATLELLHLSGQVLLRQHYHPQDGANALMFSCGRLPAGTFVVRLSTADGDMSNWLVIDRR